MFDAGDPKLGEQRPCGTSLNCPMPLRGSRRAPLASRWKLLHEPRRKYLTFGHHVDRDADLCRAYRGTDISDMVATARRLTDEGFMPMPHLPARWLHDQDQLREWLSRYRDEAAVSQALLMSGGARTPVGKFGSSIQMIETCLFDELGYRHLYVAGHPEGNRDIDPDGGTQRLDAAIAWKTSYANLLLPALQN